MRGSWNSTNHPVTAIAPWVLYALERLGGFVLAHCCGFLENLIAAVWLALTDWYFDLPIWCSRIYCIDDIAWTHSCGIGARIRSLAKLSLLNNLTRAWNQFITHGKHFTIAWGKSLFMKSYALGLIQVDELYSETALGPSSLHGL